MPAVIAHYLLGQAVLDKLDGPLAQAADACPEAFNIGTQGPDIMFFALGDKEMNKWGDQVHFSGISNFYACAANLLKAAAPSFERTAFLSYMDGFLCHYALDCCAHPYIFYKSGFSGGDGELGDESERRHRKLESTIDAMMAEKVGDSTAYGMDIGKRVEAGAKTRKAVAGSLAQCLKASYGYDREPADYGKGMKDMSFVYKALRDKSGRRKSAISLIGRIFGDSGKTAALIGSPVDYTVDWLNEEKKPWVFPWDNSVELNFSFLELFNKAVEDALIYINAFNKAVRKELNPKIALSIIGDRNFSTGLEFPVKFKYYDKAFIKKALK
jgi:hypothetical protein